MNSCRTRRHRAMTLVEVILALAVLGILLGSMTEAVSLSVRVQRSTAERAQAGVLASELLDTIAALAYSDPEGGTGLGVDAGELAADRATFDDVDDFHGWQESPPLDSAGAARAGLAGWARAATVEWVTPGTPTSPEIAETGVNRVTVTVTHNGRAVATIDRLRTRGADSLMR